MGESPDDLLLALLDLDLARLALSRECVVSIDAAESVPLTGLPEHWQDLFIAQLEGMRDLRRREPFVFEMVLGHLNEVVATYRGALRQQRGTIPGIDD